MTDDSEGPDVEALDQLGRIGAQGRDAAPPKVRFERMPDGTTRVFNVAPEPPPPAVLVEYRVRVEMPPNTPDLRADDALEQADKLVHQLRALVAACPALAGFTVIVERVDD